MIVSEFETTYYTDWKCSVCREWRRRDYPARVIQSGSTTTVQCREHADEPEEDDECGCHCHTGDVCTRCNE